MFYVVRTPFHRLSPFVVHPYRLLRKPATGHWAPLCPLLSCPSTLSPCPTCPLPLLYDSQLPDTGPQRVIFPQCPTHCWLLPDVRPPALRQFVPYTGPQAPPVSTSSSLPVPNPTQPRRACMSHTFTACSVLSSVPSDSLSRISLTTSTMFYVVHHPFPHLSLLHRTPCSVRYEHAALQETICVMKHAYIQLSVRSFLLITTSRPSYQTSTKRAYIQRYVHSFPLSYPNHFLASLVPVPQRFSVCHDSYVTRM